MRIIFELSEVGKDVWFDVLKHHHHLVHGNSLIVEVYVKINVRKIVNVCSLQQKILVLALIIQLFVLVLFLQNMQIDVQHEKISLMKM
jgi:hypothetical protein